jgi:hypothetical protein
MMVPSITFYGVRELAPAREGRQAAALQIAFA